MNRRVLHSLGENFSRCGATMGHNATRDENFPALGAPTSVATGFVVKTATPAAKFASVPFGWTAAWTFRTVVRPGRMCRRRFQRSGGRGHMGLFLVNGYEQPLVLPQFRHL